MKNIKQVHTTIIHIAGSFYIWLKQRGLMV